MKKIGFLLVIGIITLSFLGVNFTLAEQKSITLPKGTTVEKLGQGHFKFNLPNKQVIEVKNLNLIKGTMDFVEIIDPQPPGKVSEFGDPDPPPSARVITGKKGKFLRQTKTELTKLPPGTEYVLIGDELAGISNAAKVPKTDYILIDDEIVWLPAGLQFDSK
jgi:hypothetical protein